MIECNALTVGWVLALWYQNIRDPCNTVDFLPFPRWPVQSNNTICYPKTIESQHEGNTALREQPKADMRDMLSELRKYGPSFTLANQNLAQIEDPVLNAVFGNVCSLIFFRAGAMDAPILSRHLVDVEPRDIVYMPNY